MKETQITCQGCHTRVHSTEEWVKHLMSSRHQNNFYGNCSDISSSSDSEASSPTPHGSKLWTGLSPIVERTLRSRYSFLRWSNESNERSLLIHCQRNLGPTRILRYLVMLGKVTEFYVDPRRRHCIVQFENMESTFRALTDNQLLSMSSRIQKKNTISDFEWAMVILFINSDTDFKFIQRHMSLREFSYSSSLNQQMDALFRAWDINSEDFNQRLHIVQDLGGYLRPTFPSCILLPIEASMTSLGGTDSYVKMLLDPFGLSNGSGSRPAFDRNNINRNTVEKVFHILREVFTTTAGRTFAKFLSYSPGDCPNSSKITFCHKSTGIWCQLLFEPFKAMYLSKYIGFAATLDPGIKPLVQLCTYFIRFHCFTTKHEQMNVIIQMLILTFYTVKKFIPTIWTLQSGHLRTSVPYVVDQWDVSVCTDFHRIMNFLVDSGKRLVTNDFAQEIMRADNILLTAAEFFYCIGTIDFDVYAICTSIGDTVEKSFFLPGNEMKLPNELVNYRLKVQEQPEANLLNVSDAWVIQHPFFLNQNIAKGIPKTFLKQFQTLCVSFSNDIVSILLDTEVAPGRANLINLFQPYFTSITSLHCGLKYWKVRNRSANSTKSSSSSTSSSKLSSISSKSSPPSSSTPLSKLSPISSESSKSPPSSSTPLSKLSPISSKSSNSPPSALSPISSSSSPSTLSSISSSTTSSTSSSSAVPNSPLSIFSSEESAHAPSTSLDSSFN